MKKLFLFAQLLLVLQVSAKTPTNLNGFISNPQGQQVSVEFYSDLISFEKVRLQVSVRADGSFQLPLYLDEPKALTINYANRVEQVYIEPGNQMDMYFDGVHYSPSTYSGEGAIHNDYLALVQRVFKRYSPTFLERKMQAMHPDEFRVLMDEIRIKKQMVYDTYEYKAAFSPAFDAHVRSDIEHWWATQLMQYAQQNAHLIVNYPRYYNFLNGMTIQSDAALSNVYYTDFIAQYVPLQNRLAQSNQSAQYYFSGKSLAYLNAVRYYQLLNKKEHQPYETEIARFANESPYHEYRAVIDDAYAQSGLLHNGEAAPDAALIDQHGNLVRLSDFRGKVVYLDFWATWCVACIHEMEYSKRLDDQFNDQDVVFLYVSLDKNQGKWSSYLSKTQSTKGVHLYAPRAFDSGIADAYGVGSLPSYFLIDQQGNIAQSPAQRPSKAQAREDIRAVLMSY